MVGCLSFAICTVRNGVQCEVQGTVHTSFLLKASSHYKWVHKQRWRSVLWVSVEVQTTLRIEAISSCFSHSSSWFFTIFSVAVAVIILKFFMQQFCFRLSGLSDGACGPFDESLGIAGGGDHFEIFHAAVLF